MKRKILFALSLGIFLVSLYSVSALYTGTIGVSVGTNIVVNIGGNPTVNVTNDTTTPSNPTTTSGGGGTNTYIASSSSPASTNESETVSTPNFIPLSGMESPVNQTSTTPIESSGITGAVVGALTSTAGITTMAALFLLGIGTVGFFIIKKRK